MTTKRLRKELTNLSVEPLVSIVISTYGRPAFLKRCIESILNQTYRNIEIFVVDDNDPESPARIETRKAVAEYVDKSNFTYIQHEKNKNGSAARNTGWKNASGRYITFVDDDDVLLPEKIQKQVECMESLDDSWGACYTGYYVIQKGGRVQHSTEKRSGDCYLYALMRTMFLGSGSNLFLRKCVVDSINGYDESFKRNQDIEFLVRALEIAKIAYIDEELLCIYQNEARIKRTFEEVDQYAQYYLSRFQKRIDALPTEERHRVVSVIALERCRVAFYDKNFGAGVRILIQNKVRMRMIFKYFMYLLRRIVTHTSYGFAG